MEIQIPEAYLVKLCDKCETRHAPIRGCPQPEPTETEMHFWEMRF